MTPTAADTVTRTAVAILLVGSAFFLVGCVVWFLKMLYLIPGGAS